MYVIYRAQRAVLFVVLLGCVLFAIDLGPTLGKCVLNSPQNRLEGKRPVRSWRKEGMNVQTRAPEVGAENSRCRSERE